MLIAFEIVLNAAECFVLVTTPTVGPVLHVDALVVAVLMATKVRHVRIVLTLETAQIMRPIL
jgi:hypothetical protein